MERKLSFIARESDGQRPVPSEARDRRSAIRGSPLIACLQELRTRNPEPGTRNPEPGIRNPEPGIKRPRDWTCHTCSVIPGNGENRDNDRWGEKHDSAERGGTGELYLEAMRVGFSRMNADGSRMTRMRGDIHFYLRYLRNNPRKSARNRKNK